MRRLKQFYREGSDAYFETCFGLVSGGFAVCGFHRHRDLDRWVEGCGGVYTDECFCDRVVFSWGTPHHKIVFDNLGVGLYNTN